MKARNSSTHDKRLGLLKYRFVRRSALFILANSEGRHPHKTLLGTSTSPISPMSIESWLLVFFNLVAFVNCYGWLTERQRNNLFAMLPRRLKFLGRLNYDLDHWRNSLAIIGLPISVGVGV